MATGILNLAPKQDEVASYSATQAKASAPVATEYQASQFKVAPEATVSGQMSNLQSDKAVSPLLQQARTRAAQKMNERGLLSSSMAIGAAEDATNQVLLPIAQQDSQTRFQADTNTINAENAAKYANAQAKNAAAQTRAQLETNVSLANAEAATKADAMTADTANRFKMTDMETARALSLADKEFERSMGTAQLDAQTRMAIAAMDQDTRMNLAVIDRNTRVELATIENNYRQLLQMNQDLATMYNQVSTNIANISSSNLGAAAKNDAVQTQLNLLKQALASKQALTGTPATTGTTPSGPSAPNVANLNIASYFANDPIAGAGTFNQAKYDAAMADYQRQVAERNASWAAWDRGGRSGPWNVPEPKKPNREDFYDYTSPAPTSPAPSTGAPTSPTAPTNPTTPPTTPTSPTRPYQPVLTNPNPGGGILTQPAPPGARAAIRGTRRGGSRTASSGRTRACEGGARTHGPCLRCRRAPCP